MSFYIETKLKDKNFTMWLMDSLLGRIERVKTAVKNRTDRPSEYLAFAHSFKI